MAVFCCSYGVRVGRTDLNSADPHFITSRTDHILRPSFRYIHTGQSHSKIRFRTLRVGIIRKDFHYFKRLVWEEFFLRDSFNDSTSVHQKFTQSIYFTTYYQMQYTVVIQGRLRGGRLMSHQWCDQLIWLQTNDW